MRVLCALLHGDFTRLPSLAEACLALSPQVAMSQEAVFVEISASARLFTEKECIQRLKEMLQTLDLTASIALAHQLPLALALSRFGSRSEEELPVEALACYLNPFRPEAFPDTEVFHKLGVLTLGDFKKIPRRELPSRFGRTGLLAYERLLSAGSVAWPRFQPVERISERADLDFAARITSFEPVLFLLNSLFQRVFLRLYARRLRLAGFTVRLHLNRLSPGERERATEIALPLPQSEPKSVLALTSERLMKELESRPLPEALEGVSLEVLDTAPFHDTQRDFFSKAEQEQESWAALVGRLRERLGEQAAFLAQPAPRLLPEASWAKTLDPRERGIRVETPARPLRLLSSPLRLQRWGEWLEAADHRRWRILTFQGPERLRGEWWLGPAGFEREYYRVDTSEGEALWLFSEPSTGGARTLWLHGLYD